MTWDAYHRRNNAVQRVMAVADRRRDGQLPWTEIGADIAAFDSPEDLLLALQMRWHNRLDGHIEQELSEQPLDHEAAIARAWRDAASELPGTRMILDAHEDDPALQNARTKELAFLASAAGLAPLDHPAAPALGLRIRSLARSVTIERQNPGVRPRGLMTRLREAFVA